MPEIIQPIIALIVISSLIAIGIALCLHPMPEGSKEVVLMLIGVLSKSFSDVINYYFGSTAASKTKDKTISDFGSRAPAAAAPAVTVNEAGSVNTKQGDVIVNKGNKADDDAAPGAQKKE